MNSYGIARRGEPFVYGGFYCEDVQAGWRITDTTSRTSIPESLAGLFARRDLLVGAINNFLEKEQEGQ